jgi:hypothetical protein
MVKQFFVFDEIIWIIYIKYIMGKKCVPGIICIEDMTLFLLFLVVILMIYIFHTQFVKKTNNDSKVYLINTQTPSIYNSPIISSKPLIPLSNNSDTFNDPYAPPLQDASTYIYPNNRDHGLRRVPINIETQGLGTQYEQLGILEKSENNSENIILPLMGRRTMTSRDKWQYYTISNTGTLNTKLPITYQNRSCTSEYGCDSLSSGDIVYVKGYNGKFKVTVYENSLLQYLPF